MSDATPPSALPPFYAGRDATALVETSAPASDLPVYTPSRRRSVMTTASRTPRQEQLKEFVYDIKRKGKAVASMTILAEASYSKHIPTFLEGLPVKGRVQLNLEKADVIQSVVVSIQGKIIAGANPNQHLTFVEVSSTLWSQDEGHPRNLSETNAALFPTISSPSSRAGSSNTSASSAGTGLGLGKFNGKLQGEYTWDFSLDMPREVAIPHGRRKEIGMFSPPQTFNERHGSVSINYEVSVRFSRGKWQTDYIIPVPFGYIPTARPPPFLDLRRLAYQEGVPLVGPTVDLEGWHRIDPVMLNGTIFNNRAVNVGCTLFLAKPLSYTRGSLIPFCLRLESHDEQALDLLSAPKAIVVRLRRRIKYHFDSERTPGAHHLRDTVDHSDRAVLWPSTEGSEDSSKQLRFLNGELHLTPDTKPSSAMANFRIEYFFILFPFEAAGFEPIEIKPIIEQSVEIVTFYAPGPRPRKYAPPGYESETQVRTNSYTVPEIISLT
ncbi:hypothetical protein BDZ97DRAFT_1916317 [Flammula alnicola]|nr:hypothetical protein BDZ97DRAFT_1916317 [Flammula alnicola]